MSLKKKAKASNMPEKSVIEHFDDLRTVLLRLLSVLALVFLVSYFTIPYVESYLYGIVPNLVYLKVYEPILARIAIMAWFTVITALPYIICESYFYLKDSFKIKPLMIVGLNLTYLFVATAACLVILPKLTSIVISMGSSGIEFYFSALSFIQFAGSVVLVSALLASLPFLLFAYGVHRWLSVETLKEKRVLVLPLSFIISALITPPDVLSQIFVAVLIYLIYEIIILINLISRSTSIPDQIGDLSQ